MLIEVRQWLPQGLWRKMPRKDTQKNFLEICFRSTIISAGDLRSIPGLGRCPGEGNSYPLHYSGLESSKGVAKSQT